jgi:transposase InsO family protein
MGDQQRRAGENIVPTIGRPRPAASPDVSEEDESAVVNVESSLVDAPTRQKLADIYYNPTDPGAYGGVERLLRRARVNHLHVSREKVEAFLADQKTYSLHKPLRKTFRRNYTYASGIDKQWQADLVDMAKLSKFNKGYRYVLTCIDIFSKYAWAIPLKSKAAGDVVNAFKELFKQAGNRKPKLLQTDKGAEFLAKPVQALLKRVGIKHFSSQSDFKAAIVERFNRTLRMRLSGYQSYHNTKEYLDVLPMLLEAYNASPHRSIGMAPRDVRPKHEIAIWRRLYGGDAMKGSKPSDRRDRDLDIEQKVRVPVEKHHFAKGFAPNWTEESFLVRSTIKQPRRVYELEDEMGEPIHGKYYEEEVQPIKQNIYTVEKELKHRTYRGRKQVFVKWRDGLRSSIAGSTKTSWKRTTSLYKGVYAYTKIK